MDHTDYIEQHYQERIESLLETCMDLVAVFSAVVCEIRTELDIANGHRLKERALEMMEEESG